MRKINQDSIMSVVAALTDLKKYTQKKHNANISTIIFKMHRYLHIHSVRMYLNHMMPG